MGLDHRLTRAERLTQSRQAGLDRRKLRAIGATARLLKDWLGARRRVHLGEFAAAAREQCGAGPEAIDACVHAQVFLGHAEVRGAYLVALGDYKPVAGVFLGSPSRTDLSGADDPAGEGDPARTRPG